MDSVLPADPEAPSHAAIERRRSTSRCGGWPRLAASPGELREHRFLASAYLSAHAFDRPRDIAEAGLELAPDDAPLLALRGETKAGLGDPEGALADWRRALELDPEDIGALYSSAFLLEQEGRLTEAAEAWRSIIEWTSRAGTRFGPCGRGKSSNGFAAYEPGALCCGRCRARRSPSSLFKRMLYLHAGVK